MKIRKATEKDAIGIAQVHYKSWLTTYNGIMPDDYLANLSYEKRESMWSKSLSDKSFKSIVFVLEDDNGNIVGMCSAGKSENSESTSDGEIFGIYLLEPFQRKGFGKQLFMQVCIALNQEGFKTLKLGVLKANPSTAFYEKLGGRISKEKDVEIGGKQLTMLTYLWKDIKTLT